MLLVGDSDLLEHLGEKGKVCASTWGREEKTEKRNHNGLWASTNGHGVLRNHSVKCTRSPQSLAGNDSLDNVALTWIYRFNIFSVALLLLQCRLLHQFSFLS